MYDRSVTIGQLNELSAGCGEPTYTYFLISCYDKGKQMFGVINIDWQTTEKIENEFYKCNPLIEQLKEIEAHLTRKNTDKEKLLLELDQTISKLDSQIGVAFNKVEEQRNK